MLLRNTIGASLAALSLAAGSAALAQSDRRGRTERVTDEIVREVEETADAVGRVTGAFDRSLRGIRYTAEEREAIDRCAPSVQRYGRMRIDRVRPYSRRSWRVEGTTDGRRGYDYRRAYPRAFTCTVRYDGRVKVKTKRLRYRRY
ncbi:MAG TPA: hypothetical protein VHM92_01440 [Allosphingosinicella sp.]|nr:hypothetical protein [Allosphingosinicella sp.]